MKSKTINTILLACSLVLAVAGLTFIGVSIGKEGGSSIWLVSGLLCALGANLCNVMRARIDRKAKEQEQGSENTDNSGMR